MSEATRERAKSFSWCSKFALTIVLVTSQIHVRSLRRRSQTPGRNRSGRRERGQTFPPDSFSIPGWVYSPGAAKHHVFRRSPLVLLSSLGLISILELRQPNEGPQTEPRRRQEPVGRVLPYSVRDLLALSKDRPGFIPPGHNISL